MLTFDQLSFGYHFPLLQNINITFAEGKITTIIGPNGCGKSTLLKLGAGLLRPQRGRILLQGQNITQFRRKEYARRVSILLQSEAIPDVTVETLVGHGRFPYRSYRRLGSGQDKTIIEAAMTTAHIAELRKKNLNQLSGGERQRAFIAMALAQDTPLLMLDEPTTYLDINHQLEIMALVRELNNQGKTIVMVLHDLNLALHNSHRVILMQSGKIITAGTPEAVVQSGKIDQVFQVKTASFLLDQHRFYVFRGKSHSD